MFIYATYNDWQEKDNLKAYTTPRKAIESVFPADLLGTNWQAYNGPIYDNKKNIVGSRFIPVDNKNIRKLIALLNSQWFLTLHNADDERQTMEIHKLPLE